MFKTVLFDLDGTLLNTIDDLADSANRVCKAHGWPEHDTAQYKYFVGNGIPKLVERFSPEDQRDPETLQKTLAEFDTVYGAHMHDKTAPYPGMPELLAKLEKNGVKMAVFSNKADEFARAVVARYFDSSLFEIVRGALPDVPTKPAPQGTRALMQKLGVTAESGEVLYVGDSNVDVATAHNAGLPCCGAMGLPHSRGIAAGRGRVPGRDHARLGKGDFAVKIKKTGFAGRTDFRKGVLLL